MGGSKTENYFWRTAFSGNKIWIQTKDPTVLLPLDFDSSHHLLDLGVSVHKVSKEILHVEVLFK